VESFAPRNKLLIYFPISTITFITRYRQIMREGNHKATPVVCFYFLKAVVVFVQVKMPPWPARNCVIAAGPLGCPRTMNQLLDSCQHVQPTMAAEDGLVATDL
jgi:hypothetical protein